MNSSRNGSFLCCERRLVAIDQRSVLFFSLRAYGTQTPSLVTFPIFSKWRHMVDCDVFNMSANSRVLWHGLHFTNAFKASSSKFNERTGLGSSFNDVSPKQNFTNQFRTARSVMVPTIYMSQGSPWHCSLVWTPTTLHDEYALSSLPFHSLQIYYFNEMLKSSLLW